MAIPEDGLAEVKSISESVSDKSNLSPNHSLGFFLDLGKRLCKLTQHLWKCPATSLERKKLKRLKPDLVSIKSSEAMEAPGLSSGIRKPRKDERLCEKPIKSSRDWRNPIGET